MTRTEVKVFQDQYLDLTDCHTTDDVLSAVSAWAEEHEDAEVLFGYGYRDDLKPESAPQEAAGIDEGNETDGAKETAAELSASSCAEVCPETTEISKKAPLAEETSRADAPDLLDFPAKISLPGIDGKAKGRYNDWVCKTQLSIRERRLFP